MLPFHLVGKFPFVLAHTNMSLNPNIPSRHLIRSVDTFGFRLVRFNMPDKMQVFQFN